MFPRHGAIFFWGFHTYPSRIWRWYTGHFPRKSRTIQFFSLTLVDFCDIFHYYRESYCKNTCISWKSLNITILLSNLMKISQKSTSVSEKNWIVLLFRGKRSVYQRQILEGYVWNPKKKTVPCRGNIVWTHQSDFWFFRTKIWTSVVARSAGRVIWRLLQ